MYLLYLDDAGSVHNTAENHLVLGGISVFERQLAWLSNDLEAVAKRFNPQNPDDVEFHASAIWAGRDSPWKELTKGQRRELLKELLQLLVRSHQSTKVFACVIHKASFPATDPMELAFEELCSRFDMQMKRFYAADQNPQRGLIILDESSHETTLQNLARRFRSLGTRWEVLVNIPEVPLFVDSKASRMVQLADLVAYTVFRRYEAGDTSLLDILLPRFDSEGGKIHGLVHKQTNDRQCMCPACMSRRIS
jgi:hypothetical protein